MKKLLIAALLASACAPAPVFAANNMTVLDSASATKTVCSKDIGAGVQSPCHTDIDSTGAETNDTTLHAKKVTGTVATTVADGANVTVGTKADPKSIVTDTTPASVVSLLKGQIDRLGAIITAMGSPEQAGATKPTSVADGLNVALGTRSDTASCATDGSLVSVVAALKCGNGQRAAALPSGENHIGEVGGHATVVGGSFARPSNVTAYAANQLYANSTSAGSVVPISAAACRGNGGHGSILSASLSITNPLAYGHNFRIHIFKGTTSSPFVAPTVGDGGTWTGNVPIVGAVERATIDIYLSDKGSDGAKGWGTRNIGQTANAGGVISYDCNGAVANIYEMIETLDAYTPTSGETATAALEVVED